MFFNDDTYFENNLNIYKAIMRDNKKYPSNYVKIEGNYFDYKKHLKWVNKADNVL